MDRMQVAATGVSVGASALLLSCGMALVVNSRAHDEARDIIAARSPDPVVRIEPRVQAARGHAHELALAAALREVRDATEDSDVDVILRASRAEKDVCELAVEDLATKKTPRRIALKPEWVREGLWILLTLRNVELDDPAKHPLTVRCTWFGNDDLEVALVRVRTAYERPAHH